jgi:hypothetical protein
MLEKLKELWSNWKVHVTVVGGVLVVATVYGTCSYAPPVLEALLGDEAAESAASTTEDAASAATEDAASATTNDAGSTMSEDANSASDEAE